MSQRTAIHCSYHKCLTVFFAKVFSSIYNQQQPTSYRHFNSRLDQFYTHYHNYRVASVNNHALDFGRLAADARISHLIRGPRDLIISSYFYHKRGAEAWSRIIDPQESDWQATNGHLPPNFLPDGHSFATYLQSVPLEEGLIAEMIFRRYHFESMRQWATDDPRILRLRYENVLGHERQAVAKLLTHFGASAREIAFGTLAADRFSAERRVNKTTHIRNPTAGQWKTYFTPQLETYFNDRYADLIECYGYSESAI